MESPSRIFINRLLEVKEFNYFDKDNYLLGNFTSTIKKHLTTKIICPWVWSEFIHKFFHLPIFVIFERWLLRFFLIDQYEIVSLCILIHRRFYERRRQLTWLAFESWRNYGVSTNFILWWKPLHTNILKSCSW